MLQAREHIHIPFSSVVFIFILAFESYKEFGVCVTNTKMTRVMFNYWKRIFNLAPLAPLTMFSFPNITNGSIVKKNITLHEVA